MLNLLQHVDERQLGYSSHINVEDFAIDSS